MRLKGDCTGIGVILNFTPDCQRKPDAEMACDDPSQRGQGSVISQLAMVTSRSEHSMCACAKKSLKMVI